ncbi:hypothetical protein PEC730217_00720 [Pectobacterium carotovorum subsp. carotovorum]|nr:hypothetical protein [Pectobacterium carotovorum subsp. carotovorum]GBO49231.1 hypothetical protein MFFDBJGM_02246 [Pectobacterium versatile]GKW31292.1 hypothetical protein PEC730217_00720 [Pectobacterium carotovorum subsp. carotovorum]
MLVDKNILSYLSLIDFFVKISKYLKRRKGEGKGDE